MYEGVCEVGREQTHCWRAFLVLRHQGHRITALSRSSRDNGTVLVRHFA